MNISVKKLMDTKFLYLSSLTTILVLKCSANKTSNSSFPKESIPIKTLFPLFSSIILMHNSPASSLQGNLKIGSQNVLSRINSSICIEHLLKSLLLKD